MSYNFGVVELLVAAILGGNDDLLRGIKDLEYGEHSLNFFPLL